MQFYVGSGIYILSSCIGILQWHYEDSNGPTRYCTVIKVLNVAALSIQNKGHLGSRNIPYMDPTGFANC